MRSVNFSTLLLLFFILISCSESVTHDKRIADVLKELDNTIANKETYSQIKQQRIDGKKKPASRERCSRSYIQDI